MAVAVQLDKTDQPIAILGDPDEFPVLPAAHVFGGEPSRRPSVNLRCGVIAHIHGVNRLVMQPGHRLGVILGRLTDPPRPQSSFSRRRISAEIHSLAKPGSAPLRGERP